MAERERRKPGGSPFPASHCRTCSLAIRGGAIIIPLRESSTKVNASRIVQHLPAAKNRDRRWAGSLVDSRTELARQPSAEDRSSVQRGTRTPVHGCEHTRDRRARP